MRYLFAVIANRTGEVLADHDEMTAIDSFNEKIEAAGQRIMAAGIATPDQAVVLTSEVLATPLRTDLLWTLTCLWLASGSLRPRTTPLRMRWQQKRQRHATDPSKCDHSFANCLALEIYADSRKTP
jgi:hypothetical protein